MKVVFISNYLNHHQLYFSLEMQKILGNNYKFIATSTIPQKRLALGYEDMNDKYDFVIKSYEFEDEAYKLANESDVVIIGGASKKYIYNRLKKKKGITFAYSERLFKKIDYKYFFRIIYYMFIKERIQTNSYFLLCSSAYTANDYNSMGLFKNKTYKWGYFPEIKEYKDIDKLISKKKPNSIIWVGRFIDWKHPEIVIEIAKRLKEKGYIFNINMIGNGSLVDEIKDKIMNYNLEDNVKLLGSMSPAMVRENMEKSKIMIFTSNRAEGWGAVLNEAMNSACAVIASHEIGSVPFLIDDTSNGLIYEDGNIDDLYNKVVLLLNKNDYSSLLGKQAYLTMANTWNPKIAAERIVKLSESLLNGSNFLFDDGPCSKAERIKDNWYVGRNKYED